MPQLTTENELSAVRRLPFCYICGNGFDEHTMKTRDHVPPKSIFASQDRGTPLILPTHRQCNEAQSSHDEIIGQLISAIHGKRPSPENLKLDVHLVQQEAPEFYSLGLIGTNLHIIISRWLRAFHSALYGEHLPNETKNFIHPPFPGGTFDKNNQVKMDEILVQHPLFVETIKRNRMAQKLDRIACYNNKCTFECVWETTDDGQPICIFALNLYNWTALADTENYPKRGCVGMYMPSNGKPENATSSTKLEFPIHNTDKLDPFGA